jgi:hypothetical protein
MAIIFNAYTIYILQIDKISYKYVQKLGKTSVNMHVYVYQ